MSVCLLLESQIRALEAAGFDVTAVAGPDAWSDVARRRGIRLVDVPLTRRITPISDVRALAALRKAFRKGAYDVVHTHTPKAGLLGPVAARLAGTPHIVHTVHGFMFHDDMPRLRRAFFRATERFTATMSHHLLFQSREDLETARRMRLLPEGNLAYVGNGIDVERFDPRTAPSAAEVRARLGLPQDALVLGVVARLTYEKGFREIIAATHQLLARHGGLHVIIAGPFEPDQGDAVTREELAPLTATGRVHVLGFRDDVCDLYRAMDVFALASYREGIPRALMEACAMEVPAVVTNIRGCREVVAHEETGLLVPVRDAPALADAIDRLLLDEKAARHMGERARARILAHFDRRQADARIVDATRCILEGATVAEVSA